MKLINASRLIAALDARRKEIRDEPGAMRAGCKGEFTLQQVDDSCALYMTAEKIRKARVEKVSASWIFGPALGDILERAKHDSGYECVADTIQKFLKEEKDK